MPDIALFDSHCHVDFHHFDDDRDAVFERMQQQGVTRLLAVSVELEQTPRLQALVAARDNVWFSVGVHPNHEVDSEPSEEELIRLAAHPRCVAIGETGMDLFRHHVDPALQQSRFRTHIRAAHRLNKPVIVHMRDADEVTLRVLAEENIAGCGGIMHCFSSSWPAAKQALDMGMSISFSGNVTFKRNDALRDVARQVPDELLLIETDSPYLAPMPMRGKRNEPGFVRHVAECLAEVRGVSLERLAEQTTANAMRRFGIG
ncbi:MAG: DNAase [Zetaproteobacteria bacterium CG12_big_fil_rev_8_21_14_0_65_54_13]|nr:MAG: DNAase [Zetaproteobacteria bacterium CG12_big_fil_rev_8_21_14_0_65_54_13]PIX54992.1 MAG: DNAase [Zetaproteobacteria bacterium CG_4_10_14_3_um_filter_54_28]PJA28946.1 MAG: DNAase [Zetaproteobacteria bacterium CG_4_9_14_3_um_filter_54_145]